MARNLTIAILIALSIMGCASPSAPPLPHADNNLQVTLRLQPKNPRQLDITRLTVTVQDAHGQPVTNAAVSADLAMTSMEMGENHVALTPHSAGTYTGTGRFTMPGIWYVTISAVHHSDKTVQRFLISVQ